MASIPTQDEVLAATRKSQEAMIAAIKSWLETVRTTTPKLTSVYAPLTDKLPRLPSVTLPFADKLPTPEEAVASAYHTAEQLLASQRKFTEDLLKAMTPLIPGRDESSAKSEPEIPSRSAWQDAVATAEPVTQSTPARPAPRTTAAKRTTAGAATKSTPAASKSTPAASTRRSATGSSARKSTPARTVAKPAAAQTVAKPAAAQASPAPKGPEAS